MPSQQYIHGQRQQIQDRPCTCYLGEQIAGRSIYTCPRTETVFQKAISRYAVLTPVKRHKVTSRKIRGDRNRKTEYKCIPISRKGLSRISQITDTADIRGENGHPHHPAGQTSSGRSELLGGTFLLKERTTEGHDSAGKQQKTIISMICIQTEHLRFQFRTKGSASNALRIFSRSGTLKRWKGAATKSSQTPNKDNAHFNPFK